MNTTELHCLHYATGRPVRALCRAGEIISITATAELPPRELWLAPALVDLQINGYAGVDFQGDDVTPEQLLHAARALRRDGCAHFLLTLITDEWSRLLARLKRCKALRDASPELRHAIIGWHIEGPFLSARPGFCGAHNPAVMLDPTAAHIREMRAAVGEDRLLITVAPERAGALEAIALAASLGIRVSLGHTDASAEILQQAVAAGATGFTHLANGCPRELNRHDNILWRVCDTPGLTVSFIPDAMHVSPAPFRLLHRLLQDGGRRPDNEPRAGHSSSPIYYTTDAMAAAGASPGRFRLGAVEVEVGEDQIVRQPGQTNFAGSALRPVDGVFRAAQMLNCPWQECWRRFSEAPSRFIGYPHELGAGSTSYCLVDPAARALVPPTAADSRPTP